MSAPTFEWDPAKNVANVRKHKISFVEAQTAFTDDHALIIDDPDHSKDEDRFILLGLSIEVRLLVVVHCYRHTNDTIHIISARKATPRERARYNNRRHA